MDALSLSPLTLFQQAGPVGKAVMLVLAAASVWCWVLIIEAIWSAMRLRRALRRGAPAPLLGRVIAAGETAAAIHLPAESVGERRKRLGEAMEHAARGLIDRAAKGLPTLAIISSTAPFVGLFGTVWGIMTSFAGIAQTKDTSLAIVAPGIAEALAATAFGLIAAIPASVGYTRLGAVFSRIGLRLSQFIAEHSVRLIAQAPSRSES